MHGWEINGSRGPNASTTIDVDYFFYKYRFLGLKYHYRDISFDSAILSGVLTRTKTSLNQMYEGYLHQPEDTLKDEAGSYNSSIEK